MKKKILFSSIIIIIILFLILFLVMFFLNNKKIDEAKTVGNVPSNVDNIMYVEMKEETEGGYICYKTEEKYLIEKIVNALSKIEIKDKTNVIFSDDSKIYILKFYDGTVLTYCFQGKYYHKDNVNYEISNYEELMKIEIPQESK